jgi:hypothetical protein
MSEATVLDQHGQILDSCSADKAQRLLEEGKARLVSRDPLVIELPLVATLRQRPNRAAERPGEGRSLLLHICCGPCGTYPINRLRQLGFSVTGFWYNPNIHPYAEHERRRQCVAEYASEVGLPMIWSEGYEMPLYFRQVAGHEARGERCDICYRLRLERTAQMARESGFDAFTTTLLISPYQQQTLIRSIGEELAARNGVEFYFENLRRGWGERGRLAREHHLYQQQYCGCIYSAEEAAAANRSPARAGDRGS